MSGVGKGNRLLFWLFFGLVSTYTAEVLSGSTLLPFYEAWGLIAIVPLYTLHVIVFAKLAFLKGEPNLLTLYWAGVLFGLYEAYITKILWLAPWSPEGTHILGIGVFETLIVAFLWHPIMSFIVPITISRFVLGEKKILSIPSKKFILFLFIFFSIFSVGSIATARSGTEMITGFILSAIPVLILGYLVRHRLKNHSFKELLPKGKETKWFIGLLILLYILLSFTIDPEVLTQAGVGHLTIWLIYLFVIWQLKISMKYKGEPKKINLPKFIFLFFLIAIPMYFVFSSASFFGPLVILLSTLMGAILLLLAILKTRKLGS